MPIKIGGLKSHCSLWTALARNRRYRAFVKEVDITTFRRRCENEGHTFLTTTLPKIGKALDNFHSTMIWEPPSDFDRDDGRIPVFLGSAIKAALEGDSLAVDCVRQLTYLFYKLEIPYDETLISQYLVNFRNIDDELGLIDNCLADHSAIRLLHEMKKLIARVLCNLDPLAIRPRHSSGATSCRTKNQDKWWKLRYSEKLDLVYPYSEYFFLNTTHLIDEVERLQEAELLDPCARIVLVPKDSRGPRVISCEPAEYMYIQQGLMRILYDHIETHPLTRSQINFRDQSINRMLALASSIDGKMATIDLSEASDRVSLQLVRWVFPPNWVRAFEACRSEFTELPSGERIKLNKFAPMGSACCFPVEALVFWACAQANAYLEGWKQPKSYVYGDDIIVDTRLAESTIEALELIGLKANRNKCFSHGPFRESCGGDYHKGYEVTPLRLRQIMDVSHTDFILAADFLNNSIKKFGYTDSIPLIQIFEEVLDYQFPRSTIPHPGVLLSDSCSCNDVFFKRRWSLRYQRFEHHIRTQHVKSKQLRPPDWCELLRMELLRGVDESPDYQRPKNNANGPGMYSDDKALIETLSWVWLG